MRARHRKLPSIREVSGLRAVSVPTPPGNVPAEVKPSGANPSAASSRLGDWALDIFGLCFYLCLEILFPQMRYVLACLWGSCFRNGSTGNDNVDTFLLGGFKA